MAEDPFAGLVGEIDERAGRAHRSPVCVGTVLKAAEGRLLIRADGMELDQDDLYVAQHLTDGWSEQLRGLNWPVTSTLPVAKFQGKCWVPFGDAVIEGTAEVTRPLEEVQGLTAETGPATHPRQLKVNDRVLLLRSQDGQTYYVVYKFVRWC